MGGYGSGWYRTRKKTTVEDCLTLHLKTVYPHLQPGFYGWVSWGEGGRAGKINYQVWGADGLPQRVKLVYTLTPRGGEPQDLAYYVELTTSPLPWGAVRYWFVCPLAGCNRRAGALYLPPGGRYFGCRHCYNLTYRAAQEKSDGFFSLFAQDMPGLTRADYRYMMREIEGKRPGLPPPGGYFARRLADAMAQHWANLEAALQADPYPDHLTAGELCEQSGLSAADLARLEAARLLVPDTKDGRYRPKLAGWARKLAYLLAQGWDLAEVAAWARGRWSTDNPRAWPPDRAAWADPHGGDL